MFAAKLVTEEWEINKRLRDFGVSRAELIDIIRGVVGARSDATVDDPVTAGGLFAYIFGTRYIRQLFKARGWFQHREDNVESVKHPDRNLKIVYQSVDLAAEERQDPQAVSGKGSGADRLIFSGQGKLFDGDQLNALNRKNLADLKFGTWFFCVSVNGDDVRGELSLPRAVSNGNFEGFIERIFIIRPGEWSGLRIVGDSGPEAVEFEPSITRK
jgi:hypothetical protein